MADKSVENNAHTIETLILAMRGQKVILDSDLARVYGVPTKRLNEQVRRNKGRFLDKVEGVGGPGRQNPGSF